MKRVIIFLGVSLCICAIACKKDTTSDLLDAKIAFTKSDTLLIGEPTMLYLTGAGATGKAVWKISPDTVGFVNYLDNRASVVFGTAGTFRVTATIGGKSVSTSIVVLNQVYRQPNSRFANTISFYPWEKLYIQPEKSILPGDTGLYCSLTTANKYFCSSALFSFNTRSSDDEMSVDFKGVFIPFECFTTPVELTTNKRKARWFVTGNLVQLNLNFNGVTYKGTIERTGTSFKINWPDSSVIKISPLELK